jgi:hypothetical protein
MANTESAVRSNGWNDGLFGRTQPSAMMAAFIATQRNTDALLKAWQQANTEARRAV